eukprot:4492709-Alexandrium_andersonii.AAC.1
MRPAVSDFSPASSRSSTCLAMRSSRTVSFEASRRWCFARSSASIALGLSPHMPRVAFASLREKDLGASLQP